MEESANPGPPPTWEPKRQQNAKALRLFRDGMDEMHEALWAPGVEAWRTRLASRRASVELRKFLLDGTPLVHRVLQRPRFHPLRNKDNLSGDVYRNDRTISLAPASEDGRVLGPPASRTWTIAVHPLHGLTYDEERKLWRLEAPFDLDAQPMALDAWLRQRLYRVNGRDYSLMTTIRFLSNKEGAHVDLHKDTEAKDMERVHFGHVTYPHIVALLVASYLVHQYRTAFQQNEERWSAFLGGQGHTPSEYKAIREAELKGEIDPMGYQDEFHETGIPIPTPGMNWKPLQLKDTATVEA